MQAIELRELVFHAYHGVLEQERKVGNTFIVDLTLFLDLTKAIRSDKLDDTINYASVYEIVKKEMDSPSNLIEHVAGRIVEQLKASYPQIKTIEIRLAKVNPPFNGEVKEAAIIIKE